MKRFLFYFYCMISCSIINAQDVVQYIGNCKIYQLPSFDGEMYTANIASSKDRKYGDFVTASKISVYNGSGFNEYTTSHGKFVEITYSHKVTGGYSSARHMMFCAYRYGLCAIVYDDSYMKLHVVKLQDDSILFTIDNNFMDGGDFSVLVRDDDNVYGNRFEPSITVVNDGYVKVYNNLSNHVASVCSISLEKASSPTCSLDGIRVERLEKGIYIQEGKKVIVNE